MQTLKDNHPIEFFTGEMNELSGTLHEKILSGEADAGVIAKMPENRQEVKINGLTFRVQQVTKSNNVILEPIGKSS